MKSLRSEQLHLEQYLDEFNILYSRKSGDTGLDDEKSYIHKISMERYGQILFTRNGNPEKAINQKKSIFDKNYNSVFGSESLKIEDSPQIILRYFEVKKAYKQHPNNYSVTEQKVLYIIYLDTKIDDEINKLIVKFEKLIGKYTPDSGEEITPAQKLRQLKFKKFLDFSMGIK